MQDQPLKTWASGSKSPYQLHDITRFPDWGCLIILDAFFNNLASALTICTGVLWLFGGTIMEGILPAALTCALIFLIVDLIILVSDLGSPHRFFHSLRVMRFTSPLSVGVWGLSCLGISLGVATIASWIYACLPPEPALCTYILAAVMRVAIVMAFLAAVVVICYKGVVFSCSSQPGLCQARWLTPFMVSDSLLMGLSVLGIIAIICSPVSGLNVAFILPVIFLICARCITFALLWQDVKYRARDINSKGANLRVRLCVYIGGGLIALILLFFGPIGFAISTLLFLVAGFHERRWLIELARPL